MSGTGGRPGINGARWGAAPAGRARTGPWLPTSEPVYEPAVLLQPFGDVGHQVGPVRQPLQARLDLLGVRGGEAERRRHHAERVPGHVPVAEHLMELAEPIGPVPGRRRRTRSAPPAGRQDNSRSGSPSTLPCGLCDGSVATTDHHRHCSSRSGGQIGDGGVTQLDFVP